MIKTKYGVLNNSIEALIQLQKLSIPLDIVLDLSDIIVQLEDKIKSYEKSLTVIKEKYYPKDEQGNIIFKDEAKTIIEPTDPKQYSMDLYQLNNTEIDIDCEPLTIKVTNELAKSNFTVEHLNSIKWLVNFIK